MTEIDSCFAMSERSEHGLNVSNYSFFAKPTIECNEWPRINISMRVQAG